MLNVKSSNPHVICIIFGLILPLLICLIFGRFLHQILALYLLRWNWATYKQFIFMGGTCYNWLLPQLRGIFTSKMHLWFGFWGFSIREEEVLQTIIIKYRACNINITICHHMFIISHKEKKCIVARKTFLISCFLMFESSLSTLFFNENFLYAFTCSDRFQKNFKL